MGEKRRSFISALLVAVMCISLCACGKSNATETSGGSSDTFDNAVAQLKNEEMTGEALSKSGIRFTIIDSNTVKASINDPKILAYAMDMTEIRLKLFSEEDSGMLREGAFAFKIQFNEIDGQMSCNVYPMSCKTEQGDASNSFVTIDEEIPGPDGAPICGAAVLTDTMLTFVVQCNGLASIIENNPYYATYIDYEEYTKGKIDEIVKRQQVEPDLSGTSLAGKVYFPYFNDLYPEYFVIEEDFEPYKSYSGHKFVQSINEYRQNAIELLWTATTNSDIDKKALFMGSVDEFGAANYYMAIVYDSHKDLIRDYMGDTAINFTEEFGIDDPDPNLITDDTFERFIPENGGNVWGTWDYSVGDNVLYWHYIPEFNEHYKSYDGFSIPRIEFTNAGINGGPGELNTRLDEIVHEVIETGKAEGKFEYAYQWDDMTQDATNSINATASVSYKGYYHKAEQAADSVDAGMTLTEEDNAKISEETLRIRNEILQAKEADIEVKKNAPKTVDPSAECYMYDDDSTDFMLKDLDTDALASGGAYEIEFDGYVIRLTAASVDSPHCEIGKYNGSTFEKITDASCYRNLDAGPNCVTINANISVIDGVGWKTVDSIELYELKDGQTRSKISNPITINRWYQ